MCFLAQEKDISRSILHLCCAFIKRIPTKISNPSLSYDMFTLLCSLCFTWLFGCCSRPHWNNHLSVFCLVHRKLELLQSNFSMAASRLIFNSLLCYLDIIDDDSCDVSLGTPSSAQKVAILDINTVSRIWTLISIAIHV